MTQMRTELFFPVTSYKTTAPDMLLVCSASKQHSKLIQHNNCHGMHKSTMRSRDDLPYSIVTFPQLRFWYKPVTEQLL